MDSVIASLDVHNADGFFRVDILVLCWEFFGPIVALIVIDGLLLNLTQILRHWLWFIFFHILVDLLSLTLNFIVKILGGLTRLSSYFIVLIIVRLYSYFIVLIIVRLCSYFIVLIIVRLFSYYIIFILFRLNSNFLHRCTSFLNWLCCFSLRFLFFFSLLYFFKYFDIGF